ncbi:esterase-like activity of phytase family protein, partial [Candidatus Bipolaricaulota bacterium]|nr:esterase-like activity of phytase family protein [Candidatus Bipolaricaulota bacterium]
MWKIAVGVGLLLVIGAGVVLFGPWDDDRGSDVDFGYLGSWEIAGDAWTYGEMAVGELSGLAYDAQRDVYYAVSDNRGDAGTPGKLFTLEIDADSHGIADVAILDVTLLDADPGPGRTAYGSGEIDAEEVVLLPDDRIIVSSERDRDGLPWIRTFDLDGDWLGEIPVPDRFIPSLGNGVRSNLAFEAMALSTDGECLYVANEQALVQDGPMAGVEEGTWIRISCYDLTAQTPSVIAEYAYLTEPIFVYPTDGTYADNGVVAMLDPGDLLPQFDLLVLERAYSSGVGNHIVLFGVRLGEATGVQGIPSLHDTS